jgi:hypothetical protein
VDRIQDGNARLTAAPAAPCAPACDIGALWVSAGAAAAAGGGHRASIASHERLQTISHSPPPRAAIVGGSCVVCSRRGGNHAWVGASVKHHSARFWLAETPVPAMPNTTSDTADVGGHRFAIAWCALDYTIMLRTVDKLGEH